MVSASSSPRAHWGSKLGFVLAAAGSAIGLGNIWRFPYVTNENGGGIFVLLYLLAIVLLGLPVMLAELTIGRHTQKNPVGAFGAIAPGWKFVGYIGVFTGVAILSYYGVVAGWTVGYVIKSATGNLDPDGFDAFIGNPVLQLGYLVAFVLATMAVVAFGVKKGIERMAQILMPLLLLLMFGLVIRALTLPTAASGLRFYLYPNFDAISPRTVVYAIGQAFFSLSLGMGAMITYGSYINPKDNLASSAVAVVSFDTLIALLAGFLIFPVIGHGLDKGGPTLVFVTMIEQFNAMAGGRWVALLFFVLLAIAALTSTVSLLEVATAYLVDEHGIRRRKAVLLIGATTLILGVPSALSLGAVAGLSDIIGGMGFLDIMDFLFGNVSLTLGALLTCIFLVYRWGIGNAAAEIATTYPAFSRYVSAWKFMLGFMAPLAIGTILVYILITGEGVG
jgi:neurotransmitter:Na+ symporter, NSS family